jgi:hypothetical protein
MTAFTSGPEAATPPDNGADPFLTVPNQSNENINPVDNQVYILRTALQSPTKAPAPTTPQLNTKSTPLRRRFLKEVSMSPATPPQSPSPTKSRASPTKTRSLPIKSRGSPTKQVGTLEIGQNVFYYQCELPESKITPNKADADVNTPWRRTPSPTKMGSAQADAVSEAASPVKETPSKRTSPAKSTPSKAPPGSPLKKVETPSKTFVKYPAIDRSSATKNGVPRKSAPASSGTSLREATTPKPDKHINSARTSPTKSIKLASRFAQGASTPTSILGHKNKAERIDMKEEARRGLDVAPATQTTATSSRPLLSVAERTPTRAKRGSSFNMGDMMAGLKDIASKPRGTVVERVGETDISEPPTPLRKAAEKLQPIVRVTVLKSKHVSPVEETRADTSPAKPIEPAMETRIASPFKIKEHTVQYRSLPVPVPPMPSKPSLEVVGSSYVKKHVNHGSGIPVAKSSRPANPRRAVTDPVVLLPGTNPYTRTILEDMNKLKQSLSLSLGVDFEPSRGKENTFELPTMANSAQEFDPGTPASTRPNRELLRTTSDVSTISSSTTTSSVRASMFLNPRRSPTKLPVAHAKAPKWPYSGKTPAQARRERLAAAKEEPEDTPRKKNSSQTRTPMKLSPSKSVSSPRFDKTIYGGAPPSARTTPRGTPGRSGAIPTLVNARPAPSELGSMVGTPSEPRGVQGTATSRAKPTPIPGKPKSTGGAIPQSARKSVFDSPATKRATLASKSRSNFSGSNTAPKSTRTSRAAKDTPQPTFVGADAIAEKVAEWGSANRRQSGMESPQKPKLAEPTPSKTKKVRDSYTPEGSPTKKDDQSHHPKGSPPKLTFRSPIKPKPKRLAAPSEAMIAAFTPKRAAPATPKVRNKALDRARGQDPKTPVSRAVDPENPNAYRTPSKEIESSLDRAIDEKIEEYARSGKEFTPSGNRVKSLLEARGKGGI